ncbi:surfactin synthase thioesterase subunit [Paenibacillus phyllosphaerae]|uniref:Surfactin synthase thioesterase subunit n=1 Tax=Paenibacillus phyllosphaerae TaxID=274593 RepID=A0A7W5B0P9_9BACL|nr:thioesterase [Paenibacillus phyllosphaerae]MBB3112263.1 surfactin synthase thioesterase subunit [Paenibacillus phyllosphaerae]
MSQNLTVPVKLYCFPFAGAGASFYNGWNDYFGDSVEVVPVQLPGRERLIAEEPYRDLHTAADAFASMIETENGAHPVALFGHCFLGATMAFEVARRLESRGTVELVRLFISAASTPHSTRTYKLSSCADDCFVEEVQNLTGFTHHAFAIPELRELLLPALRADFEMDETYIPASRDSIHASITAMYATEDSFVSQEDVARWQACTSGEFELFEVNGEHMYITHNSHQAKTIIQGTLAKLYKEGALHHE